MPLFKTHVSYKQELDFSVYRHYLYFEIYQNSDFDFEQLKIKVILLEPDFGRHILPHHPRPDHHLHSNQDFQRPLLIHRTVVLLNHLKNNLDLNASPHHHFSYCQIYIRLCHPYQ